MKHTKEFWLILILFFTTNLFSQSKNGYKLVWEDNFNQTELDTIFWNHEVRKPRSVNNELQRYTYADNLKFEGGKLLIIAKKEIDGYSSARINTKGKKTFTYGIIEIKAKLPKGMGTWPALWMLGDNIKEVSWPACGEMDIMEHVGSDPGVIHSSIHNLSGYGGTPYTSKVKIDNPYSEFHIYSMEWTTDFITFYVDGNIIYKYQPELKDEKNWPFYKPAFIIFNVAIGGDWGGKVDDNIFPTTMTVDWVKVYQKK
jgi:beta-glucanase (GH16 family)